MSSDGCLDSTGDSQRPGEPLRIAVVNAGLGNPRSCIRMLQYIGSVAFMAEQPEALERCSHVILPGVGHFDAAILRLRAGGWADAILRLAESGRPLLGICLGMQLLGTGSAEGSESGLGLLPWRCERIPVAAGTRVPHMGWNTVSTVTTSRLHDQHAIERFYFVHGYYVGADAEGVTAVSSYGVSIASTVEHGNIFGVQFHPEKSHSFGMRLLKRFSEICS